MYATIEQAIQAAKQAKAKHAYLMQAVIVKTEYKAGTHHIGLHFDHSRSVGDKGIHPDGSPYEIVAIA